MKLRIEPITITVAAFITLLVMFGSFIAEHERQGEKLNNCIEKSIDNANHDGASAEGLFIQ